MNDTEDELLMAYADGELDPERAAAVEARIAADQAARDKVHRFRETAALVRAAFARDLDEVVPPSMEAAIRRAADTAAPSRILPFRPRPRVAGIARFALPLAASLALVVGLGGGWWIGQGHGDQLAAALETAPSGQAVSIADGAISPVSSFRDRDGRWCREFQRSGTEAASGVACRIGQGRWRTELQVANESGSPTDYAPAGEGPSPLDATLERLGAGQPVDPAAEAQAIAGRWR